ncbi:MAG: hypothetical protein VX210_09200 [Myxococcota bacterium]|nr:hypothetical protein [Myxococcota bacterium]
MRPIRLMSVSLLLMLGVSVETLAADLVSYGVSTPITLMDSNGMFWRGSDDGLKMNQVANDANMIIARWVNDGIQIETVDGRVLIPIEGRSTGFYGKRHDPSSVFKLIRHYDGRVSLMSQDGKVLFVDTDQTIRREKMPKIGKNAFFSLRVPGAGGASVIHDPFDCTLNRIKEIRKRYSKVANNKTLTTKVVASEFEHEYHSKTTHRFFKGAVAEEHIRSGFSGMEANRYTYFHRSQRAYFEYDVSYSDGAGETTEVRRYSSGKGTLCRCLYRSYMDGESAGPQFQSACEYESVKRNPQRAWE